MRPLLCAFSLTENMLACVCVFGRRGDIVRAVVTEGTKQGTYTGRIAIRTSGSFNVTTAHTTVQGINRQ
jgi:hypothetical protein